MGRGSVTFNNMVDMLGGSEEESDERVPLLYSSARSCLNLKYFYTNINKLWVLVNAKVSCKRNELSYLRNVSKQKISVRSKKTILCWHNISLLMWYFIMRVHCSVSNTASPQPTRSTEKSRQKNKAKNVSIDVTPRVSALSSSVFFRLLKITYINRKFIW